MERLGGPVDRENTGPLFLFAIEKLGYRKLGHWDRLSSLVTDDTAQRITATY